MSRDSASVTPTPASSYRMNRMRMLYPAVEVWRLVRKLARDVAMARDTCEAGTNLAVRANNARNGVATTAAKTVNLIWSGDGHRRFIDVHANARNRLTLMLRSERRSCFRRIEALQRARRWPAGMPPRAAPLTPPRPPVPPQPASAPTIDSAHSQ